jgi:hypothetical protein
MPRWWKTYRDTDKAKSRNQAKMARLRKADRSNAFENVPDRASLWLPPKGRLSPQDTSRSEKNDNTKALNQRVAESLRYEVWEGLHDRIIRKWMTNDGFHLALPNYCRDLNAMHEAERGLDCAQSKNYARILEGSRLGEGTGYQNSLKPFYLIHATARQRAEAFLETMGQGSET